MVRLVQREGGGLARRVYLWGAEMPPACEAVCVEVSFILFFFLIHGDGIC